MTNAKTTAGISIMALGALAQDIDLTVVPVGLNYFHAHKFRSRAVVEFGDPVSVSPELIASFKNGKKRESVAELLGNIYESLTAVTVTTPDFETLQVIIPLAKNSSSLVFHANAPIHSSCMPHVDYTSHAANISLCRP